MFLEYDSIYEIGIIDRKKIRMGIEGILENRKYCWEGNYRDYG